MKPNTAFVITMLAMCSVAHPDQVSRDQIKADHIRLMNDSLTSETKSLLLDLTGVADESMATVVITADDIRVLGSGILRTTEEERILICRIYGSQGREIEITDDAIIVSPSELVLKKKRQIQKRQLA